MNSSPQKWCWSHGNHGLGSMGNGDSCGGLLDDWSDEENQGGDRFFMYFELVRRSIIIHYLLKIQLLQRFQERWWKCAERLLEREQQSKLAMEWGVGCGGWEEKLVTNQAFAWKLVDLGFGRGVKLIACKAEGGSGEKKVREATHWQCHEMLLGEASCFLLRSSCYHLAKFSWISSISPHGASLHANHKPGVLNFSKKREKTTAVTSLRIFPPVKTRVLTFAEREEL